MAITEYTNFNFANLGTVIGLTLLIAGVGFNIPWAFNAAQVYYWALASATGVLALIVAIALITTPPNCSTNNKHQAKTMPSRIDWAHLVIVTCTLTASGLIALPSAILCVILIGYSIIKLAETERAGDDNAGASH